MVSEALSIGDLAIGNVQTVDVSDQDAIQLDADFLFSADFARQGDDLLLRGPDGGDLLLQHYFAQDQPPQLETVDGARLSPEAVDSLAGPAFPVAYAQAGGSVELGQPIGEVSELNGVARVQHPDGTRADLQEGDPIVQGDVVSTGVGSELGIVFVDDTVFSLSSNARMVIDELIYSPQSNANSLGVSLIQGTFVFVTGQIAPSGGMDVDTPVGTIGIRGTTVGVQISTLGGSTRIVNLVNPDTGETGSFIFSNGAGSVQFTQTNHFLQLSSASSLPGLPAVAPSEIISNVFGRDLGNAIGIQRQIERDSDDTPPTPPDNPDTNEQEGELPQDLLEALLNELPIETASGEPQAQGGGAEFRLPPWFGQFFGALGLTPQGVIGEVDVPELEFAEIQKFFIIFTPESPVAPRAAFGLPGASTGGGTGFIAAIKEDSTDNLAIFAANAGTSENELTSIVLKLPGFTPGDLDISNIIADLAGPPSLGNVAVTTNGGVTQIVITFDLSQNIGSFASSFTLDAPAAGSDADLPGIKITASAQDLLDPSKSSSASASGTLVLDAVLDETALASQGISVTVSEAAAAQAIPLNLSLSFIDAGFDASGPDGDGSEAITNVTVVLAAGSLVLGPAAPAGAAVMDNGGGSFTVTVADPADFAAAVAALQVAVPAGLDGQVTGTIFVTTTEISPTGAEVDSDDNSLTLDTNFSVMVTGGTVTPLASFSVPSTLSTESALAVLSPQATPTGITTILEDSEDNVISFSVAAGDATDELVSVQLALPGIAPGDIDIAQITADLAGPPLLGSAVVSTPGGVTTIVITFADAEDIRAFSSAFTLDAPVADSDLDLENIQLTVTAKDITTPEAIGTASTGGTIYVDAVADPVTVSVDAVSSSGDEAFAPGETGTVTVDATFGDSSDGSELHTVTVTVPLGFSVTDTDGGTQLGDEISWTTTDANFQAVLQVAADDPLPGEQGATWQAEATAVEQNSNTDPAAGDVEQTTANNTEDDQASDSVTLDPAGAPTVSVSLAGEALCIAEDGEGGFTVTVTAQGDDYVSAILVANLPGVGEGWTTSVVGDDGGSFDPATGIYTTSGTPGAVILTVTLAPPADSDLDVATVMGGDISFTATTTDPNSGDTATAAPVGADVDVDAVADPVTVSVDAVSASGDEAFAPGETGTVTVDATFGDSSDGSELHTVTVTVPLGFSVTDTDGGTQVGDEISWTTTDANFQAVLQVAADDPLPGEQGATWQAEATAVEQNTNTDPAEGDVECDSGDNEQSDQASDSVTLDPAGAPTVSVSLAGEALCIAEDGQGGFTVTVTAPGDDFVSAIQVANLPGVGEGWTTSVEGDDGGSFDPATGIYTTSGTPGAVILTVTLAPPADSDLDVATVMGGDISFTATTTDPNSGDTATSGPVGADVDVDAVADPVTVSVDAVSASGDEAFAPGETGTVTVDATFGDSSDGSELHTVTVTVPLGFTVTDTDGGTQLGDEISWTTADANFQAVLQIVADDPSPGEFVVTWEASASAVEQNSNTDPAQGDVECDTDDNEQSDQASDQVALGPALPLEVETSLQGEPLCISEDGQGDFTVTVTAQGDDFVSAIQVGNLPGVGEGWTTSVVGDDGGSFDPGTGLYTTSGQPGQVILTVTLAPPADSDLDVATVMGGDISFTATAEDPDSGDTATSDPIEADVDVDAVADTVSVAIDAVSASGDEAFAPGETGTVTVDATFGDSSDGSELHTVTVTVPLGFSVTDTDGGTQVGDEISWTTTDANFQAVLQVVADDPLPGEQGATWQAEATAVEQNSNADSSQGDVECDTGDNEESDASFDAVTLDPAAEPSVVVNLDGALCIAEDGEGGFTVTVTAQGDDYVSAILVGNLPGVGEGWTTSVVGDDGGSFDPATGIYTTSGTPGAVILTVTLAPPADSDLDVETVMGGDISFTATTTDPNSGDTATSDPIEADVDVDAVADPVTVSVDAVSASGDEAFAPGETGTVTVDATFGDNLDGSELHTVTVTVPLGFSVTDTDGGTQVGDEISWTTTDANFQAVLQVVADDPLPGEQGATWQAEATAVEQNTNTDPAEGDVECDSGDNEQSDQASDSVTLDPAAEPSVVVNLDGALCIAEDGEGDFTVTVTAQGDDYVSAIQVGNLPGVGEGWTTSVVGDDGGSFDPGTGIYTTSGTPGAVILTVTLAPPADSDLDVATVMGGDISFTATTTDPDSDDTATAAPVSADVDVDAVADGESAGLSVSIDVNDSGDPDSEFSPGETGTVKVSASFGDYTDGSEVHTVVVDIPEGFTVVEPLPALAGATVSVNGDGDVEFLVAGGVAGFTDYVFEVTASAGVADGGVYQFSATATALEEPNDEDCDTENNEATSGDSTPVASSAAGAPTVGLTVPGDDGSLKEDTTGDVAITADVTTPGDTLSQVVVTAPAGWVLSATAGGQIAAVEGDGTTSLTLTLVGGVTSFSGLIQATPPEDSDVDGSFTVEATAVDGSDSAVNDDDFDVPVDAVADGGALITTAGYGASTSGSLVNLALLLGLQDGNPDNPEGDLFNGGGFDEDGSEAVTTIQVTLSGSPAIASDTDASLLYDAGFGGGVAHVNGSLVWTFTGSEAALQDLVASLQLDPADDYTGTITVQIAVTTEEAAVESGSPAPGGDDSNGASGAEADDGDNAVTETFSFDVQAEVFLAGAVGINEIGLGVGTSVEKHGGVISTVNSGQNYIEIRNIVDHAVSNAEVKSLMVQIIGADGGLVTIDLSTATGGSINIPPLGFLTIFEDGTWATSTPGGEIQQTGTYAIPGVYTEPGSVWGFGEDTSDMLGVYVLQDSGSVDMFLANGADGGLFGGTGGNWVSSGSATANAAALLGALVGLDTYSGLVGDQDALLAALGRSDIVLDDAPAVADEGTRIFARVFADADSAGANPGDDVTQDSNTARDWTTSNEPTSFASAINDDDLTATDDFNPQDPSDDLNPAQGAGTNGEDAGQTVLYAAAGGDSLQGGRGQDFLFGNIGADLLQGGDHNDFLFGDRGDDWLEGGGGADFLVDVDGADLLIGGSGDDILVGGQEHLPGEVVLASAAGDLLIGDDAAEAGGFYGEDVILGGGGGNLVFGDTLLLDCEFEGSLFDYAALAFTDDQGVELRQLLDSIGASDWIESGSGNDSVMGQGGADSLFGGAGDDLIFGGAGDDFIDGGAGSDSLHGGDGSDIFVLRISDGTDTLGLADVISDFDIATDSLGLTDGLTAGDLAVGSTGGGDAVIMVQSTGSFLAVLENIAPADVSLSDITTVL